MRSKVFSFRVLLTALADAHPPADVYSYFLTFPTNPQPSYGLWVVESLPDCFVSILTPEVFTSLFLTDELIGLTSSVNPFCYHFHFKSSPMLLRMSLLVGLLYSSHSQTCSVMPPKLLVLFCNPFLIHPFFCGFRLREPELSHTPHTAFIVGRVFGRRCYAVCLTYSHKLSHHHVHIDFYSFGRYRTYLILFRISLIHLPLRLYRRFFLFHNLLLFL